MGLTHERGWQARSVLGALSPGDYAPRTPPKATGGGVSPLFPALTSD